MFACSFYPPMQFSIITVTRSMWGNLDVTVGDPRTQGFFLAAYVLAGVFILAYRRGILNQLTPRPLLWMLILLAASSTMWSLHPDVSGRRAAAMIGTTLIAVYLAGRFSVQELVSLLGIALAVVLIVSLAFVAAGDGIVESGPHRGFWQGAFGHKNTFGKLMSLAVVVFLLLWRSRSRGRWIWATLVIMALLLIPLSGSASSLMTVGGLALLGLGTVAVRHRLSSAVPFVIPFVLATGVLAVLVVVNPGAVAQGVGREETLTGRTDLWEAAQHEIGERPILGHGFSGFWVNDSPGSRRVWGTVGWEPLHAHNGFIDVALDLGFIGLTLVIFLLVQVLVTSLGYMRKHRGSIALFPALYLFFFVISNLTESALLRQNSIYWILVIVIALRLPRTRSRSPAVSQEAFIHPRAQSYFVETSGQS